MTIKSIRTGWTGISALAGNEQWFSDFESIASVNVDSSGSSAIEFTNIPSTYKHLQLRGIARNGTNTNSNNAMTIRMNSDSGANYSNHYILGDGSSVAAGASVSSTNFWCGVSNNNGATAGNFGVFVFDILDYADTNKHKTARAIWGLDNNGSNCVVGMSSGRWGSSSAITSLSIAVTNNHVQYTTVALYGIRG